MRYYSQYGQDRYVRTHLLPGPSGCFVDVGADDGVDRNNTLVFEQAGWTGLCIEPSPTRFQALRSNRACDCLNVAVSSIEAAVPFLDILGYGKGLSGIIGNYDPRHLERIARETTDNPRTRSRAEIAVPARRLDAILAERGISVVHFCSIDVEGSELDVLQSIDTAAVTFQVLAVEDLYGNAAIAQWMAEHGFRRQATIGQDLIFVNERFAPDL